MVHEVKRLFTLLAGLKIEFLDFLWMVVKRATHCPSVDTRVIHDGGSGSISIPLCLKKRRTGSSFHVEFLTCILEDRHSQKNAFYGWICVKRGTTEFIVMLLIHSRRGEFVYFLSGSLFFVDGPPM